MSENTLTTIELEALDRMQDSRRIDDRLLREFKTGKFREFYEEVKRDKNLVACFRGNSKAIVIYYHNHKVWELSMPFGKKYKVAVSINHARYSEDYKSKIEQLKKLHFRMDNRKFVLFRNKHKIPNGVGYNANGIIYCTKSPTAQTSVLFDEEFVKQSFAVMKACIDDFFDPDKTTDWFLEDWNNGNKKNRNLSGVQDENAKVIPSKKEKPLLVEKRWQQVLYHYFKQEQDGIYVYDLEFSQKYPSKKELLRMDADGFRDVTAKKIKDRIGTNEPDMLGIRFKHGCPQALVLIEVKSTWTACAGRTDIKKHLMGMWNYSNQPIFMRNRRREAHEVLEQYKYLGLFHGCTDIPSDLPVERLLILTDNRVPNKKTKEGSAIDYYNYYSTHSFSDGKTVSDIINETTCDLQIVKGAYWEEFDICTKK